MNISTSSPAKGLLVAALVLSMTHVGHPSPGAVPAAAAHVGHPSPGAVPAAAAPLLPPAGQGPGAAPLPALPSPPAGTDPVTAARGVLERLIGERARDVSFEIIPPAAGGKPVYEVSAEGGRVLVRGSSGTALCRGVYAYLKKTCRCMMTWGGAHLDLPPRFPGAEPERVVCPFRFVLEDNICAFGYTTAFYGWKEWERHLDWMALHGCNLQMAPSGSEAIWKRVWKSFGVGDKALDAFFTGPAFLPWHRMGNINGHDGPLPASWHEEQIALEKKILERMRALGIEPIAPAFSGFVPKELAQAEPEEKILPMAPWCGFPKKDNTYILHPLSPLYPKIGGAFIGEWKKEFGPARFYQADSFNELQVPVPPDRKKRLEELARFGEAVYSAIRAGDPRGVWVMMAWLFFNGRNFWDKESAAALLSRVPDDKMLVLDLYCEKAPMWKKHDAFLGKSWIYSVIPNWGGNSQLGGDLAFYARAIPAVPSLPGIGKLAGFGLSPEGTENNEVVFELISDAAWSPGPIDLPAWLGSYCRARYGGCPPAMAEAWRLLAASVYGAEVHHPYLYQKRPGGGSCGRGRVDGSEAFEKGVERFLSCAQDLGRGVLFRNDAVELAAQYLSVETDRMLEEGAEALKKGDIHGADLCMDRAFSMLGRIDALLAAHTLFRLDRWVNMARAFGRTPAEKNYFEEDAKRQITVWGGPYLSEYAAKVWSGLIGGYYAPRWRNWYAHARKKEPFDVRKWEEKWITTPGVTMQAPPAHPVEEALRLIAEVKSWEKR